MGKQLVHRAGDKFNHWTLLGPAPCYSSRNKWYAQCDCEAATIKIVFKESVTCGATTSCGCVLKQVLVKRNTRHEKAPRKKQTGEYKVWCGMIQRCTNPKSTHYGAYGGRGIRVCDRWRRSFPAFLEDMGYRPAGTLPDGRALYWIERDDNDGDYEPSNCYWARADTVQPRNRRCNTFVEYEGKRFTIVEWAERTGMSQFTISTRLGRGWSPERVLTEPVHNNHGRNRKPG